MRVKDTYESFSKTGVNRTGFCLCPACTDLYASWGVSPQEIAALNVKINNDIQIAVHILSNNEIKQVLVMSPEELELYSVLVKLGSYAEKN